jgi:hypothetical protein
MAIEEINPEHRVTSTLHDHWHKLLAVVLFKLKVNEITITAADIGAMEAQFPGGMPCILAHEKKDGLHLSVISEEEARRKGAQ